MNKSVPTLLGVAVILLVVVLVVLLYNIQLTKQLGNGLSVVGTVGGEKLTGVEQPTTQISPNEALAARAEKHEVASGQQLASPRERHHGAVVDRQQAKRTQRQEAGQLRVEKAGQAATK